MTFTSFVCFILICYLVQTKGRSDSSCPKSFSCGNLTDLSFPFTLSTQSDCGFLSISGCDAKPFPRIQLLPGGDWYYALGKPYNYTVWLRDTKLEATLRQHECQVFDENFSLTNSPYISFNILNLHNFFKCNKSSNNTLNVTLKRKDHFTGYEMYDGCDAFSIYYKLHGDDDDDDDDRDISAGNLTAACSLVRLPIVSVSNNDVSNKTAAGTSKRGHLRTPWFIVATGTFFSCIGLLVLLFYFREKILWYKYLRFWDSNAEDHRNIEAFLMNYGLYAPKRYSYSEVKRITSHFKNKLGQGGCGNVYKGRLHNGKHVAVKLANRKGTSGEEFINEVASISKTSHVNIVSLVGFCFEGRRRALIYEFMPNGSLEKFIYEERSNRVRQLSWPILYKIARGIARGLEYLHRGCTTRILHFDIKPHNILLDDDFCPKISDFGLAKLCMKKESVVSMLGARGTIGYIAPEIVCRNLGGVSHKSDVYSYGMMVLEMVGGRKNVDVEVDRTSEIYFPHWLYRRIELDEELQLIGIMNDSEKECARKMVLVSLWCIQTDPSNRPSMSKVVEMLEGNQDYSLQIPPKPYLYPASRSEVKSSVVVEPAQALFVDMSANILYEI
ncbi:rust resistance kinase Lr10-like isoform X2 [Nicotiana tabacum]|uniref:Rust resistance kinase Lr10-like isoform X2 n=1 Tax=Nicotiana tabacum TaxID=4097 RepID=A0AC58TJW5_TOBAC